MPARSLRLRRAFVLLLALLACLPSAKAAEDPLVDERPADEILSEIFEKRDLADPRLFDVLGRRRNAEALRALESAARAVQSAESLDRAFAAFRHLLGGGVLERRAIEFLAVEAQSELPYIRRPATRALASFGGQARVELEGILADHPDPECRRTAVGALVPMLHAQRTPAALELLIRWYRAPISGPRELGVRTLRAFDDEGSLDSFEEALGDRQVSTAMKAMILEALAGIGGERALEIALDALHARSPTVQLAAIRALTALGCDEHVRELGSLEHSPDPAVRHAAFLAQVPIRAGDKQWPGEVLRAARSRDFAMRMAAAAALGTAGGDEAAEVVYALLSDESPLVRRSAVRAAGELRRDDALPLLVERMQVETLRLRDEIRAALVLLTGTDHGASSTRWSKWWQAEGASFHLPPRETARAAQLERERRREYSPTQALFYGIPIQSDRVAFVLDVSGSMAALVATGGMRIDAVKKELVAALRALPDGARFNLLFFDDHVFRWKRNLVPMDGDSRALAIEHAERQGPGGGTALYDALIAALEDQDVDTILLLSDGEPSAGEIVEPDEILERIALDNVLREAVIHTISVNSSSDLLRDLARETGGTHVEVR